MSQSTSPSPEQMQQLSETLYALMYPAVKRLWVDVACIHDFRLGALLASITSEEEYEKVLQKLPEYAMATDRNLARLYSELGVTETSLARFWSKPEHAERLWRCSPMTGLFEALPVIAGEIQHANATRANHDQLEIVFRVPADLPVPSMVAQSWFEQATKCGGKIQCEVATFAFTALTDQQLDCAAVWILDDLEEYLNATNIAEPLISKGELQDYILIARRRLSDQYAHLDPDHANKELERIQTVLAPCCTVRFLEHLILVNSEQ